MKSEIVQTTSLGLLRHLIIVAQTNHIDAQLVNDIANSPKVINNHVTYPKLYSMHFTREIRLPASCKYAVIKYLS